MSKSQSNLGQSAQFAFLSSISVILPRIVSFALRGTLVRLAGLELLGLLFVRLELLSTTILFFSRESLRRASVGVASASTKHSINLTWLFLPIGLLTSILIVPFWSGLSVEDSFKNDYATACWLIGLSAIVQMFEEPVYYISSREMRSKPKTVSEASMLVFRAFAYVTAAILKPSILSFALAHLISSFICAATHWFLWKNSLPTYILSISDLLPSQDVSSQSYLDQTQLSRMGSFYIQGIFKNILTQAERYVVTFFDVMTLSQQGLWDTVTSIGALFPRFVFKPLEEGFHLHFCQNKKESDRDLSVILRISILIGLFAVAIGIPQAWSILFVYGGKAVSGEYESTGSFILRLLGYQSMENPAYILQLCFVNTLVCAMNGILEAYMFAVMSTEELYKHNQTLFVFSAVFIVAAVLLGKLYLASGLIYAQILNMTLRIINCCQFAAKRMSKSTWSSVLKESSPGKLTLIIFILSSLVGHFSQPFIFKILKQNFKLAILVHSGLGGLTLLVCVVGIIKYEAEVTQLFQSMGIVQSFSRKLKSLSSSKTS